MSRFPRIIIATAIAAAPSLGLARNGVADVPVYRASPQGQKLYVEASLSDGVPRLFLVDTGAVVSVLSASVAEEVGLETRAQPGRLVGLGGSVRWERATAPSVQIDGVEMNDVHFAVGVPGVPSRVGLVPLAGILGNNVWKHHVMSVDYVANRLRLDPPTRASRSAGTEPLLFDGQHIRTPVVLHTEVDGSPHREKVIMEVDTGARGLILSGPMSTELSSAATSGLEPVVGVGAGDDLPLSDFLRETRRVAVSSVEVGGMQTHEPVTASWLVPTRGSAPVLPVGMSGLLGHSVLDGHLLVLDYPQERISLRPSPAKPQHHDIHKWGLRNTTSEAPTDRAKMLIALKRLPRSTRILERHLRQHPDDAATRALLARVYRTSGDPRRASKLLEGVSPAALVDTGEIVAAVNAYWLAGDSDGAIALAESAVAERPESPVAWVARADACRAAQRLAEARSALLRANELSGNPDGHLLRRAWVAHDEGDQFGVFTHTRRLIERYPGAGIAMWMYANAVQNEQDRALFFRDVDRAQARLHPTDGPMDFLAGAYHLFGDEQRAQELRRRGYDRDCGVATSPASSANCEAWYLALSGHDLEVAEERISAALSAHPNRTEFLDTDAIVQESLGNIEGARQSAWRAASLAPDDVYLLWQAARLDALMRSGH